MLDAKDNQQGYMHVLDLPALYTRPTGDKLLSVLGSLVLKPASFRSASAIAESNTPEIVDEKGIPQYLTSIISSSLSWIQDESLREEIWNATSRRLAERAGRSAASSLTRTFNFPEHAVNEPPRTISIHEPSLTADNLGHKTWSSSYVVSLKLYSLADLVPAIRHRSRLVLELGSGTGLFGIAFAAIFSNSDVLLTDLPEIVPNLKQNVEANEDLVRYQSSTISAGVLNWNSCPEISSSNQSSLSSAIYDVILAADPIYSPSHPMMLMRAILANLRRSPDARLIIGLPIRDVFLPQINQLWDLLKDFGLDSLAEGEEECTDDWVDKHGQMITVRVRWAVWAWERDFSTSSADLPGSGEHGKGSDLRTRPHLL